VSVGRSSEQAYLELDGRLYAYFVVQDYPRNRRGEERHCVIDDTAQTVRISRHVPSGSRLAVVARTFGLDAASFAWRPVSVRERERAAS
jgi:hypothetical protein